MNHIGRKDVCLTFELLHEKKITVFETYVGGLFVTGASISQANHMYCKHNVSFYLRPCCRKEEALPAWEHCSISGRSRNINTVTNSVGV